MTVVHQNRWKLILSFIQVKKFNNFIMQAKSIVKSYLMCQSAFYIINQLLTLGAKSIQAIWSLKYKMFHGVRTYQLTM
jgi:hypothetical protein